MDPSSLLSLPVLRLPRLSPDGRRVAYVEQRPDLAADGYVGTVWVVSREGGFPRELATWGGVVTCLAWQGERLWVAVGSQVWVVDPRQGPSLVWQAPGPVVSVEPRPGSDQVAAGVLERPLLPQAPRTLRGDRHHLGKWDGRGPLPDPAESVWLLKPAARPGSARRLGEAQSAYRSPAWSRDGRLLAALARRPGEESSLSRVVVLSPEEGRELEERTPPQDILAFSWLGQGEALVWAGREAPYGSPTPYALYEAAPGLPVQAWPGHQVAPPLLLCDWRWAVAGAPFAAEEDGQSVLTLVQERGSAVVRRFQRGGESRTALGGPGGVVSDFHAPPGAGAIVYVRSTPATLDEVFVAVQGGEVRQLTHATARWLGDEQVVVPQAFSISTADGLTVDATWTAPPHAQGPVPTVVAVHGGPHAAWGDNLYMEHQILARRGIGVLTVNPRGSSGYGQDFAQRVVGRWGEEDLGDVLAALDRVVAEGKADPSRLAIMGTSYGGFLSAWAIGHTSRFCTAVVQAPVTNLVSMYGTSDIGSTFLPFELGGQNPFQHLMAMWERSPLRYVDQVRSSVLLICGEEDDRCPIGQSEEYYVALRQYGVPVTFLRYPGESHLFTAMGTPSHRLHRLQEVVRWLEQHLARPRGGDGRDG
jgi:dipeptidyl aminopeptidase/acylaminoacyl peptidase